MICKNGHELECEEYDYCPYCGIDLVKGGTDMEVEAELDYEHEEDFSEWTDEDKLNLISTIVNAGKHTFCGTTIGNVEVEPPEQNEGHY